MNLLNNHLYNATIRHLNNVDTLGRSSKKFTVDVVTCNLFCYTVCVQFIYT
jgi:hypothetical protein